MPTTVTIQRVIFEQEIREEHGGDDPRPIRDDVTTRVERATVIDLAQRLLGGAMRKGPRRAIEATCLPAIADGRGGR